MPLGADRPWSLSADFEADGTPAKVFRHAGPLVRAGANHVHQAASRVHARKGSVTGWKPRIPSNEPVASLRSTPRFGA
jgi:hypothetical protein